MEFCEWDVEFHDIGLHYSSLVPSRAMSTILPFDNIWGVDSMSGSHFFFNFVPFLLLSLHYILNIVSFHPV